MRFVISDENGHTWSIPCGPALVYLSSGPDNKTIVYRADFPDAFTTVLDERDKAILDGLLGLAMRAVAGGIA